MIEQLQRVLAVREARLRGLEAELAGRRALLRALEDELADLDRELAQIAAHRTTWESEWHHWLRKDRMVCHGQDHNLSHLALSAWERDARQQREEVLVRHEEAAAQVREARSKVMAAHSKLAVLRDELKQQQRRLRSRAVALQDDRASEERAARMYEERPVFSPGSGLVSGRLCG